MTDPLEQAFLRLRDAADADEYVPTEQVIDTVLARLAAAHSALRLGMSHLKGFYPVPYKEAEVLATMQAAIDGTRLVECAKCHILTRADTACGACGVTP